MGNTKNTGYLQNIVQYDASNNITLPAKLAVTGTVSINNTTPYDTTQFSLDVNGGLLVKNINKTAQFVLINSNPATGGNNAFVVHTVGGTSGSSYADIQGYYGTSIAGSTVIRLNPQGGNVLVGSLAGTGTRVVVADATGVLSTQAAQTIGDLNGVPTSRTITINGTTYDLSANRSWSITSMIYPGAGIAVSTGTAWGTSITDNSANWNTAYGWGNHASAGYATTTYVGTQIANLVASAPATLDTLNELAAALGNDPSFATTVSTSIGTKVPQARTITINGTSYDLTANRSWTINSMVYPSAGIALSTGTAWGTSITDNSANWNTAFGWGNHASGGYLTSATAATTYASLTGAYANPAFVASLAYSKITGVPAFLTSYSETDTLASVTARGASTTTTLTLTRTDITNIVVGNAIYFGGGNNYLNWTNSRIYSNVGIESAGTISASNFSGSSSGTNTGDQTNISGNAATATTATNFNNGYAYSSGSTVYVDTLESINTNDWLELVYYGGVGVRIGTGVNGSKALYAGSLYDAGNRVYSAGNPQVNITGNAATASNASALGGYAQDFQTVVGTGDYLIIRNQAASKLSLASWASVQSGLGLGTMAYASTSSYVPYSGASGSVDLGSYTLTATSLVATSSGSGKIRIIADYAQNYIESYDSTLSNWSKLVIIAGGHSFRTNSNVILFDIDSSGNVGVGQSASGSFKFNVLGTGKFSGQLTLGSTITNGTYTYTLPSATGTLALTSAIPTNNNQLTNGAGYITGVTNISGTAASETLATVTGRGATSTAAITISRVAAAYGGTTQSFLIDGAAGNGALTINAAADYAYLSFAQAGVSKWEIGAEGAATNKGSLYFNHNIQVGSTGAALYIKKSNGFVGILNIAPTTALDVTGAGTFSGTISASNFSGTHSGSSSGSNTGDQTNISGNAATATVLSTGRTNYKGVTDGVVVGELMWKQYGNSHTIFDASAGTAPNGTAKSRHTPDYPVIAADGNNSWGLNANLMGWNGANTYGVKVDWSRYSESSGIATQVVTIQDAAPSGSAGRLWWESDTGKLKVYYGSAWVDASPIPDSSLFFAKAGGVITGDVSIGQTLNVVGNTLVQGTIYSFGDVIAYSSSDSRLKDNITVIESPLEKVSKINGVTFNWNDKQSAYEVGKKDIGVIAQEVEEVLPELVTTRDNGYKAVRYEKIIALLIEAVKEQQTQINNLTDKLNNL